MKQLLICISILWIGCVPGIGDKAEGPYEYKIVNESDHELRIHVEEYSGDVFPSELTLLQKEFFLWVGHGGSIGSTPVPFWATVVIATFDDVYVISYPPFGGPLGDYVIEDRGKNQLPLATYTFTNADYEAAKALASRE